MLSVRAHLVGWLVDDATDRSPDSVKGHSNSTGAFEQLGHVGSRRFDVSTFSYINIHTVYTSQNSPDSDRNSTIKNHAQP